MFGQRILISIVVCIGHLVSLMLSFVILYFEYNQNLTVVQYLYEIKNNLLKIQLNEKYAKKYYRRMNFIAKHLSWPFLANQCANSFLIFCLPTYIAYFKEQDYNIWSVLFWTPINMIAIFDFNAHILGELFQGAINQAKFMLK